MSLRSCRNPYCDDWFGLRFGLCPSCRYIGKRAFAVGAFLAGAIAWVLR